MSSDSADIFLEDMGTHLTADLEECILIKMSIQPGKVITICFFSKLPDMYSDNFKKSDKKIIQKVYSTLPTVYLYIYQGSYST